MEVFRLTIIFILFNINLFSQDTYDIYSSHFVLICEVKSANNTECNDNPTPCSFVLKINKNCTKIDTYDDNGSEDLLVTGTEFIDNDIFKIYFIRTQDLTEGSVAFSRIKDKIVLIFNYNRSDNKYITYNYIIDKTCVNGIIKEY